MRVELFLVCEKQVCYRALKKIFWYVYSYTYRVNHGGLVAQTHVFSQNPDESALLVSVSVVAPHSPNIAIAQILKAQKKNKNLF